MQLNDMKHIIHALAKTAHVQHRGLMDIWECYLEAPYVQVGNDDPRYVWNGDKSAPEMLLDIAEQVDIIFKEAHLDRSILEKQIPAKDSGKKPVHQVPASAKI
jgi:hypothetical protein